MPKLDAKTARILSARLTRVARVLRKLRTAAEAVTLKGEITVTNKAGEEVETMYNITVPTNIPYDEYLGRINSELEAGLKAEGIEIDGNVELGYDINASNDPLDEYLKARLSDYIKHDEFIGNKMVDLITQRFGNDRWYDVTSKDLEGEGTGGLPYRFDYYPTISAFLEAYYSFTESMDEGMSDEAMADDIVAQLENSPEVMEVLRDQSENGDVLVMMHP